MIAQVYVARRFLRQFALVAGGFVAVLFLIDLIEQIRRHAREGAGLARMAGLAALNITSSFYAILPLITLLAAIALQLFFAAQGKGGFHDLAAVVAQSFTVLPALLGMVTGLSLARIRGHRLAWRSPQVLLALASMLTAGLAAAATLVL